MRRSSSTEGGSTDPIAKIIAEVIETEKAYVDDLDTMLRVYRCAILCALLRRNSPMPARPRARRYVRPARKLQASTLRDHHARDLTRRALGNARWDLGGDDMF